MPAPAAKAAWRSSSCRRALEDAAKLYSSFDEIIALLAQENPAAQQIPPEGPRIRRKTQQPLKKALVQYKSRDPGCLLPAAHL